MLPLAILVGGYGTRLGSLTREVPKCLIYINGRPFIDWQIDLLQKNGFSELVFCVSYKSELIQEHLGDGKDRGISIRYSFDGREQLGTGGAILKAIPKLGKSFGVIYGDSYLPISYSDVENRFLDSNSHALMTVYKNSNQYDASNVEFTDGKLINYEKGARSPNMKYIDYGLAFFRESAFHRWKQETSFDLSKVCHELAKSAELDGFEVNKRFYEIGSIQGIKDFSQYLREAANEL
jgi:MurNAc alpha-1-phosphate uridylyltransferase